MSKVVCPPTAAGLALGGVLRMFGSEPTDSELTEVFDPAFLASIGGEQIRDIFAAVGEAELIGVDAGSPTDLRARLRAPGGEVAKVELVVSAGTPHRIIGLAIRPETATDAVAFDELVPAPVTVHASGLTESLAERFSERLPEIMAARRLTGLAAAVVEQGRVAWHASVGWAGVDPLRPVEARSVFRAYSISKLVATIAVLQLWEQQQFDLDDPVNEHLVSMRVDGPGRLITVRDLLTHRSGLGGHGADLLWTVHAGSPVDVLGPVIDAPGRPGEIEYSNAGFGVLTQLVEDLSGSSFNDYALENILVPLGMTSSDFRQSDPPGERFVEGHDVAFDEVIAARTEVAALTGAGGLFTTAPDLAALSLAVIGGGANGSGRVVSEEAMAVALQPAGPGLPIGLGFFLTKAADVACAWHNGGGLGFSSVVVIAPEAGAAVAVLTNTSGAAGGPDRLEADVLAMLEDIIDVG